METPRILAVQALENKRLLVKFANGLEKVYDCMPLIERFKAFKLLEEEGFFKQVTVDPGGYGISWSDEVDISEFELWTNAVEVMTT
ncbi:MAG: DUF2442 domain-containing protein [Chloroflexi bacterium]|nr:DUF2442 domain-containing protein [Chloroflexota bacterium]